MDENKLAQLERRVERMEAINAILNLMGWYQSLHSANKKYIREKDDEFLSHWAKNAPNTFLEVGPMGRWEGYDGIERHTRHMGQMEEDMTGRFFEHHITTPMIEVAGDAQTAKAIFFSPGIETHPGPDGKPIPMWCWGRYRADFIKEDGVWKFWRVRFHVHFNTPYQGGGWVETPNAAVELPEDEDVFHSDIQTKMVLYAPDRDDFDVLKMVPAPFGPYETYTDDMFVDEEF